MECDGSVSVGGRISDHELWPCTSCGVRTLTTERLITCSGPSGIRTPLDTMRLCQRCYQLHPALVISCAYYFLKYGKIMPQLEEWLAKETEPTFDLNRHILRVHGIVDTTDEPPVEPYKPSKIIVPIGAA